MNVKFLEFEVMGDHRGSLVAIESYKQVPFEIKRVYYIFGTKFNVKRGVHAHKNLQQILIAVSGSCTVVVDDGFKKQEFEMDSPRKGLFIDKLIWREIKNFSSDCVLLVLASDYYSELDYIRDYDEFKKYAVLRESSLDKE
ncbi:sugar 3,4-ketoisomerase [Geobacillus vulcani]|uniref:sugar 3,4-ketoisomerase n=1 Tax=Geobacillus vulcani TaxID=135517 RepID=UPI0004DF95BC|nr:FdtA/QdtA family cupin domain-containing protein [Geobacillus vulcani]